MIFMKRSFSNPIRSVTRILTSTRVRSDSWLSCPIRQSINSMRLNLDPIHMLYQKPIYFQKNHSSDTLVQKQSQFFQKDEINNLKKQIVQLLETIEKQEKLINDWKEKYKEQEKLHNQEIALLKSNLDNSIFCENNKSDLHIENHQNYEYQVEDLQTIKEESEGQVIKSLNQSVAGNLKKTEIINILNKANIDESINDDENESLESFILLKFNKLVKQIQKLENDLEDWKRNYWNLEKQFNSQLKEDQKNGAQEIEIEFDFENNQILQTNIKPMKQNLKQQNEELLEEIKKLKEMNKQLEQQQKKNSKLALEQLILHQKHSKKKKNLTLINEPFNKQINQISQHYAQSQNNTSKKSHQTSQGSPNIRNELKNSQYFSHYFQSKREKQSNNFSPGMMVKLPITYQSTIAQKQIKDFSIDHYYNFNQFQTPIIVKKKNLSPYQKSGSKLIQF